MKLARIENGSVVEYPLSLTQVRRQKRNVSFPANPPKEALESHGYAVVEATPQPTASYGEKVVEGTPEYINGAWRQTWQTQSITLTKAKQMLTQKAAQIYIEKVTAVTPQQLLARGFLRAVRRRDAYLKPRFTDVVARIQAANTITEAHAVLQEFENHD